MTVLPDRHPLSNVMSRQTFSVNQVRGGQEHGLPDEQDVRLAHVLVRPRATEILLPVFYVSFLIKYLDEVEVAVVRLLEAVLRELNVNLLPLLGPDDPGAVERGPPLLGVGLLLLRDVGRAWNGDSLCKGKVKGQLF